MDRAKIRTVATVDGVNIAYWTIGEGEPFIYLNGWPFENCAAELERQVDHELYEHLSRHRMLVRYDGRGSGSSDRNVEDLSLNARTLDLAAVVGRLPRRPISLLGFSTSSPVAILFAARHPDLVSRLILYDAHADMTAISARPETQAITNLARANWQVFTETISGMGYGWASPDRAREYAAFMRDATTPDVAVRALDEMAKIDVSHLLPELKMPVLVLQHRDMPYDGVATAEALAAAIPDAELQFLDGSYATNIAAERGPIAEFLGSPPLDPEQTRTMTILFTDIVDSTRITQRLGDEKAQELVRAHNAIVRDALRSHYGSEVKHTGDGIMASFLSADHALAGAVQIQRSVAEYNAHAATPLELRVGANAGTPVVEDDDLFGSAVQMAARVCRVSEASQILITAAVRALATQTAFQFVDQGPATLRGFEEPTPLFAVNWRT